MIKRWILKLVKLIHEARLFPPTFCTFYVCILYTSATYTQQNTVGLYHLHLPLVPFFFRKSKSILITAVPSPPDVARIWPAVHQISCMLKIGSLTATATFKIRSRSQFFAMSQWCIHANLVKIQALAATLTLKIKSRSLRPNQLFARSQWCIHANLVWIWPLLATVTFKIRSRSPKPTTFYTLSHWCIYANLERIRPLIHKVRGRVHK